MTTRADLAAALRAHWLAVVTFLLLAVIHTWPMATNPGVLSRNDNGDTQLNEWIMAWVVHQLPRDPLRLFDSGHTPESYRRIAWTFWYFPQEQAIKAMREAGVTHFTVHPHRFGNDAEKTIEQLRQRSDDELLAIVRAWGRGFIGSNRGLVLLGAGCSVLVPGACASAGWFGD